MIKLISSNGKKAYDLKEYIVDTVEDIKTLPYDAGAGSSCFVMETADIYLKNNYGEWVKI